jgi:MFS family permease
LINAVSYLAVIVALLLMGPVPQVLTGAGMPSLFNRTLASSVKEGLRFVVRQPIILSSMLLDFFATFFSTATALLPKFAGEILAVGPVGYGWLAAAPSFGAITVAVFLAFRRTIRRQGRVLLVAVMGFGLATVVFGLSRAFWLTFAALALTGATDGLSTIIRNTIRQVQTPDNLRGRMTSVNQLFFMGGPQLGEMEAGLVAQWLGVPFAVISGGIGCMLSVVAIAARYPALRRYRGDEPSLAGATPARMAESSQASFKNR